MTSDDDDRVVAFTDAGPICLSHFRHLVLGWHALLAATPGNRVLLYHEDSVTFAAALLGAWHAGKQVLLPGDALPATLSRASRRTDIVLGPLPGGLSMNPDFAPMETGPLPVLDPLSTSLVLFTSGSSGEPVAIEKNLRQLQAEVAALEACFGDTLCGATIFGTVSHQHIYGLLFRVLWPLAYRRPFHARRLTTPEQIAALPGAMPAVLIASPAHLKRLPDTIDWKCLRSRLQAVFSSGGPLSAQASTEVERHWLQTPIEVFGSTETGGVGWRQGTGKAWTPLPGVHWRITDGLLEIKSPHLPSGDWQQTSDRVSMTGDGFALLGRADRIAKIEERRVSLSAIEQALTASGLLTDVRVVVLDGPRAIVAAVAVATAPGQALLAGIGKRLFVQHLRTALADAVDPIGLPRRWRFVDTLPVNAQGKTTDAMLVALFKPRMPETLWLDRGKDSAALEFDVSAELAAFDGHFPVMPVLPGVALVDWTIRLGREAFAVPDAFVRMDVLKFQLLVRPGTRLRLSMDWNADKTTLGFRYTSALGTHASGRLLFGGATP